MPEAASSISARTMASRISGGTCAMNSERKASSSALSDIVFSSLDLGHAAIDVELDSGNVTRLVRCEERNSFGDLIRISQPAERNVLRKVVFHLRQRVALLPSVENWRVNMSRADGVDADAAVLQFVGPGPRERPDRRLGGAVNADRREAFHVSNRPRENDRPTVVYKRKRLLHGEEHSFHVGVEVKIVELLVHAAEWRQLRDPGIREDHVDLTVLLPDLVVQTIEIGQASDI